MILDAEKVLNKLVNKVLNKSSLIKHWLENILEMDS